MTLLKKIIGQLAENYYGVRKDNENGDPRGLIKLGRVRLIALGLAKKARESAWYRRRILAELKRRVPEFSSVFEHHWIPAIPKTGINGPVCVATQLWLELEIQLTELLELLETQKCST